MQGPGSATRIGVSLALTGPEGEYGRQTRVAVELALEDARLDGVTLRVLDDASDTGRAANVADELIADPDVVAVIGPMNSWTALVQAPRFAAAGLTQVTHSASSPALAAGRWPSFRRLCPPDDLQAGVLARVASRLLGARRVAAVGDGTDFATPLVERFLAGAEELGLEPMAPASLPAGNRDQDKLDRLAVRIADARPDAVLVVGLEEPCRSLARALRTAGSSAVLLGTDAIKPTRVLVTGGETDGPYLTCSCADARSSAPELHARIERRHGHHDSVYTVEAYDATRLVLAALARTRERPPHPSGLRAAVDRELSGLGVVEGAAGAVALDAEGERVDPRIGIYHHRKDELTFLGTHDEVLK